MNEPNEIVQQVEPARAALRGAVHHIPLLSFGSLGKRTGGEVYLKAENLQKTGSFKVRGALYRLLNLREGEGREGVVTVSAGNHAQALAWAARSARVPCTVVMPESASRAKIEASRAYGATVVLRPDVYDAFSHALAFERDRGLLFVHPFDDPLVIAGQGTVGAEILEEVPDASTIVVPVGGGGLIAGIAAACRARSPGTRIIGVEPEGAPALHRSLQAGRPVRLDSVETIADGLAAPMAGDFTYAIVRRWVEDVVLLTDEEIRAGLAFLLERGKLLAEPAGAAAVAALLCGRIPVRRSERVVAVISGGNVDPGSLLALFPPDPREG